MGQNSMFIAQYDYLPQRVDELALMKGDIVMLVEDVEDGWAKGEVSENCQQSSRIQKRMLIKRARSETLLLIASTD